MAKSASGECKVDYNFLGKSGLKVSNICLGTMTFGKVEEVKAGPMSSPTQADESLSHQIMDRFVEFGGNFIDTANVYSLGKSEQIIGNWLSKHKRDDIVLATKVRMTMGSAPDQVGLGRRHIMKNCEDSLSRLQTDYIDLYQTHCWDAATPIEETYRAMDDLVRCGKVRYIGVSNVSGWQLQKIVERLNNMGISPVISLQQQYNLLCRHPEFEEFQVCVNEGIGIIPWSPLKGGILTGKFKRGETPAAKGSRVGHVHTDESKAMQSAPAWSKYANNESYWNLMEIMGRIGRKYDKTVPQVAIRWLLQKNVVPSVIIGATSVKQLEDNMGAGNGWCMTLEEMNELDTASQPEVPYPYEMINRVNSSRNNSFYPSSFLQNTS